MVRKVHTEWLWGVNVARRSDTHGTLRDLLGLLLERLKDVMDFLARSQNHREPIPLGANLHPLDRVSLYPSIPQRGTVDCDLFRHSRDKSK